MARPRMPPIPPHNLLSSATVKSTHLVLQTQDVDVPSFAGLRNWLCAETCEKIFFCILARADTRA